MLRAILSSQTWWPRKYKAQKILAAPREIRAGRTKDDANLRQSEVTHGLKRWCADPQMSTSEVAENHVRTKAWTVLTWHAPRKTEGEVLICNFTLPLSNNTCHHFDMIWWEYLLGFVGTKLPAGQNLFLFIHLLIYFSTVCVYCRQTASGRFQTLRGNGCNVHKYEMSINRYYHQLCKVLCFSPMSLHIKKWTCIFFGGKHTELQTDLENDDNDF